MSCLQGNLQVKKSILKRRKVSSATFYLRKLEKRGNNFQIKQRKGNRD
jgi:hypothetical protein